MATVVTLTAGKDGGDATILLDDGTGLVHGFCPNIMLEQFQSTIVLHQTVDCVGIVESEQGLRVHTLALVKDVHAETLRWLEISHQAKNNGGVLWNPYQPPVLSHEHVLKLIHVQSDYDKDASEFEATGVKLRELALACSCTVEEVTEMVQELQVRGEIYQSRHGTYLPL